MSRTWFDMSFAAREQLSQAPTRPDETSCISIHPREGFPMNKPFNYFNYLFPALAILLAIACLGVPARATAQDYCYECERWEPEEEDEDPPPPEEDEDPPPHYFACRATEETAFEACRLLRGGRQCSHSNRPGGSPNCLMVLDQAGRVYSAELPRRMQEAAPATNVLPEVARHGCTGGIVRQRYSPARIAELRSGLRHVKI